MAAPVDKLKKLEILQDEAKELAVIRGSNVWRKMMNANETRLTAVINEFATTKSLPDDPMKALIYMLKLRAEAANCLKLVELFNEIEDSNITGLNAILGGRPMMTQEEDEDLHGGSQI
jgi:hypothetical protein